MKTTTTQETIDRARFQSKLGARLADAAAEFAFWDDVQVLTVLAALAHARSQKVGREEAAKELRELADALHVEAL